MNIFEKAARGKIRFPYKGQISVEDLWDLSIIELDKIFKALNSKAKLAKEESLLDSKTKEDELVDTQIEIIKYIVTAKSAEAKARKEFTEQKKQRDRILSLIADKQDEELKNKSIAELEAML